MNKCLRSTVLTLFCGVLGFAPVPSIAAQKPEPHPQRSNGWPSPTAVVNTLAGQLSLTDGQKAKVLPIITARQQKLKAIHQDKSMRKVRRELRAKRVLEESDGEIMAILSPRQQIRYSALEQAALAQAKERMAKEKAGQSQ